jgi:hypothetical protein
MRLRLLIRDANLDYISDIFAAGGCQWPEGLRRKMEGGKGEGG